ncbi:HAD-IA family hydrolase [Actinopolyspora saharensis]|uniref:Haloacid dehalogenase superfamily, subfamily IA, variant 3 with third motif having DD or ED/haloacid dehalogenase superfamily, subfamily IA, variant 1 with third motif having Dx(3-4)D or Dx(3-4)E n=1 Tax=Actinopolyspora saharensis TaxID=995062 RepID=A0A1H1E7D4_9ACTN|nr:HAD-IA family hydrolase [Actinopolyspora saharensis]SDQ84637.1 haloacid dehalogenase superfamily, subfamily IA, variant 3 with third motif having DD or ED/haloacid dehalogenase superfamily, subfamily IA, variant 1 with third motif having Dx(3-4)D or Dx(3-4)E [Actinopolyspora saharensis]
MTETELAALIVDCGGVLDDPGRWAAGNGPVEELPPLAYEVRRLRTSGVAVALLSNGDSAPGELVRAGLFDGVVLSGEVGMSKPDPAVYRYTARLLGVSTRSCVFVDDLRDNVAAAVDTGMVGVLHREVERTRNELTVLFDLEDAP